MSTRKGGLGRGLGSLIPSGESKQLSSVVAGVPVDVANLNRVPITSISPNPRQPRTVFDEEKMAELITSIKEVGVLQPPVVRVVSEGRYELIMGERRWRAAKAAGLQEIPVIIRQTPDNELLREARLEDVLVDETSLRHLERRAGHRGIVVDDDLVEEAVRGAAKRAVLVPAFDAERMVLELQALDRGVGRHGVDSLLAAGAIELQRRIAVELGIVEFRDGRGAHDVAAVHHHRIVVGLGDAAMPGDAFVEAHLHDAVFGERVQRARLRLARLQHAQRLGDRHLEDQDLAFLQRRLGHAVASLDDGRFLGRRRRLDVSHLGEEAADRNGVGRVVGALVDHLQRVVPADDGRRHLDAAGAPSVGQRHLAAAERHLIARHRHRFQDGAADHALGLFVEVGVVVRAVGHDLLRRLIQRCLLVALLDLGTQAIDDLILGRTGPDVELGEHLAGPLGHRGIGVAGELGGLERPQLHGRHVLGFQLGQERIELACGIFDEMRQVPFIGKGPGRGLA